MFFRQLLNDETACASYLLGCKSRGEMAVVDPHAELVDTYVALADAQGVRITAAPRSRSSPVTWSRSPPGHDAEVPGDEPCVMVDFGEIGDYAKRD